MLLVFDKRGRSGLIGRMVIAFARSLGSFTSCHFSLCALYHTFLLTKHENVKLGFFSVTWLTDVVVVLRRLKY